MTMTEEIISGFRFRNWDIYKDAMHFRRSVNTLFKNLPKEERFELVSQTRRALTSIVLNIAEGANRNSDKDKKLFINRAHTSLDEVVACLDCASDDGYIRQDDCQNIFAEAESLAKRLRAFGAHLSSS